MIATMIEQWWASGERVGVELASGTHQVFLQRLGDRSAPSMTLLHGFPSSSHDWAKIAPALAQDHALLMPDFLGYGASDKPRGHAYSLNEQADLIEAVWAGEGITRTRLVAHDYAVSVAQELLARSASGDLAVAVERVDFLNGGLYPDLHRPEPVQTALLDPEQGPAISEIVDEALLTGSLAPTFAPDFDATSDIREIWHSMARDSGQRNAHLLIRYITDRQSHSERWVNALKSTDVPLHFIWGMLDPVSGAHMAERIREQLPHAPFVALEDVAHWPPLEAPDRVLAALIAD
jgi:pimeloyl-ACP methyl ester carboxylesterase